MPSSPARFVVCALSIHCGGATGSVAPVPPTGESAAAIVDAICVPTDDNALRATCTVTLSAPAAIDVTFGPTDGSRVDRIHGGDAVARDHLVPLYLMAPDTPHTWQVSIRGSAAASRSGAFTTSGVPIGADVTLLTEGVAPFGQLLFSVTCDWALYAVVSDPQGTVLWYQEMGTNQTIDGPIDLASPLESVFASDAGTVLALGAAEIREVTLSGQPLPPLVASTPGGAFHHDVMRRDGKIYALFNEAIDAGDQSFLYDGFEVHDAESRQFLGAWHLVDAFPPPEDGSEIGLVDLSHANGVWADGDGDVYVSMRHLSAVAKVAGDPDRADFGAIVWRLAGDPAWPDFGSDFTLSSAIDGPGTFSHQHDPIWLGEGQLSLFDNRDPASGESSRGITVDLDVGAGTAAIVEAYDVPTPCAFEGGSVPTAAGGRLVTCAETRTAYAFEPGGGSPVWEGQLWCASVNPDFQPPWWYVAKFTPVDL